MKLTRSHSSLPRAQSRHSSLTIQPAIVIPVIAKGRFRCHAQRVAFNIMIGLCEKIQFANGARFALPKMVEGPPGCPSGPSITCSSSTLAGDFGPLHRGPISRPYPTREPLLIGAPRAGSAEPTDGQAIAASSTTIRNCIQCRQETITLYPRYSTFAQHLLRLIARHFVEQVSLRLGRGWSFG